MLPNGLLPGGEPFFLPGNQTGCLLIHGFTGAPQEVRWLGHHLAGQGYTVHGVRLAGHGTQVQDMRHVHWRDWYHAVLDGYNLLRQNCQRVFAVGLSMGAALSLLLAANEEVSGVAAMSTPYRLRPSQIRLARLVRPILYSLPKRNLDDLSQRVVQLQTERGEPVTGHVAYNRRPVGAVLQLAGLLDQMRGILPQVRVPLLLIHARHDDLVPLDHMQAIHAAAGSDDKTTVIVERGAHVVTEDCDHAVVFEAVSAFIAARI